MRPFALRKIDFSCPIDVDVVNPADFRSFTLRKNDFLSATG
ncbi:hypothetical protein HMPREF1508_1088 [Shuttleworthella sp. MSX8B]|nr:hypothetical protein HMPREF1508_1088 [Shuttleworthia sp. MSX8B]